MERCFSCAEIGNCSELYVRKPPDYRGPYFPNFERYIPPSSSNAISPDGTVKVCGLCKIYLNSQWQNFEFNKMPESRRMYFTKRHDEMPYSGNDQYSSLHSETAAMNNKLPFSWIKSDTQKPLNIGGMESINLTNKNSLTNANSKNNLMEMQSEKPELSEESLMEMSFSGNNNSNKQLTENHICCFVCGMPCLKWHAKTAYSSQMLENKEYFPFFEKLDPPHLSIGLTNGATKICIQCEADLSKQWDHYEKLGTDQMSRIYHITNDHSTPFSLNNPGRFITNAVNNNPIFSILKLKNTVLKCSLCLNKIIDSYKVSWNQRATCLCIPNLKNFPFPTEGVMVDKNAEETIICDVCHYFLSCETQKSSMTPFHLREYQLPKVGYLPPLFPRSSDSTNKQTSNSNRKPSLGNSLSAFMPADSYQQMNAQSKRSRTPNLKHRSKTPSQTNEHGRSNSISKNAGSNQDQPIAGPIIANCHICLQELRDPSSLKMLRATANEEFNDQPFFPFLKTLRSNSMKNFEFPVCLHCYYNLCGQWRMSHKASIPIYERKYNHNEFMCTQCQRLYAQKSDTLILRDRLVCTACSDNRNSDTVKSGFISINQDSDANTHGPYAMKTKTTVTVTPISTELSVPSLASFNYAETMKQYSKTSISTSSASSSMNNSLGQFVDSISRNSSVQPDIYYNSKNIFGKSVKRPVVAAVAPNQRQNTPLLQSESNPLPTDFSHMKMSEFTNFPGNYYSHNSAFNPFPGNLNASSNNNSFTLPMLSSNSPFGVPSHSSIGRKHSSTNPDRDYLLKHTANFSSPYLDPKSRNNPIHNSPNPFINCQQPSQQQPLTEPSPTFPFPSIPGLDSFNSSICGNSNKEAADMALKMWMMSQNPMQPTTDVNSKFLNSCFNNSQFVEEMASSYWQMMLSSSLGAAGREDLMAANLGLMTLAAGGASGSGTNNLQSWMANAAMTNYQYQMLQMLGAYQSSVASPQPYSHGINKPPAISNWMNQFNYNDPLAKLCRPETGLLGPLIQSKLTTNANGFNDLLKHPEFLKASLSLDYDKIPKPPQTSFNYNPSTGYSQSFQKQPTSYSNNTSNTDRFKTSKVSRDEISRTNDCKTTPSSSPKPSVKMSCNSDSKFKKVSKTFCQSDVLDLSQNRSTRKSSYAIDSLTEHPKKTEKGITKFNSMSMVMVPSVKDIAHQTVASSDNYECPLNMSNSWINTSLQSTSEDINKSIKCSDQHQNEPDRFINILKNLNAHSLVDIVKSLPEIVKISNTTTTFSSTVSSSPSTKKPCAVNFNKCPTVWQFHQFLKIVHNIIKDFKHNSNFSTRTKSRFMKELGLQDSFIRKQKRSVNEMKHNMINHINSSRSSKKTKYEIFWTKWILRNLKRRLSLKNKPHLRRSLMRPVLSGDIEVRFCAAKNKHELENLRSIIKILIKYT